MALPVLIYYGVPDLRSQVFQGYMQRVGYVVEIMSQPSQLVAALAHHSLVVTILSMPMSYDLIQSLVGEIRTSSSGAKYPIFILANEPSDLGETNARWISGPDTLRQLVRSIQDLTQPPVK